MTVDEYVDRLERNLMVGSVRWITDFSESFRELSVDGWRFTLMARGAMRTRGLLLSRLFATLSLPNYLATCLVYRYPLDRTGLKALLRVVARHMRDTGTHWCWIVLPGERPFPADLVRAVELVDAREVGIALVDLASRQVFTNPSYIGRRMKPHVGCFG